MGPAGNVYDKYGSRNLIARAMMTRFLRDFDELVARTGATRAHEVGCGEGYLCERLARRGLTVLGTDHSADIIRVARTRLDNAPHPGHATFQPLAIQELQPDLHGAELIVCCEVLEHLEDPIAALEHLGLLARPYLLVSVPREPLWRVLNCGRLRYLRHLGNTPGHINHWSRAGFLRMLARHLDIVDTRSPLPWTMALCRARA